MSYKTILQSQKAHNRYQINRSKAITNSELDENSVILQNDINSIKMFVFNNNRFKEFDSQNEDIFYSVENNIFTKQLFQVINNKIILRSEYLNRLILLQNNLRSFNDTILNDIVFNGKKSYVQNNLIYLNTQSSTYQCVGQFIPNINAILLTVDAVDEVITNIQINYSFIVHQYQYLCQIKPNQMNRSMNPTAYDKSTGYYKNDDIYITTIGLYNDKDQLISVAKLSQPVKKSKIIPTNILITFDYIE